MAQKIWTVCDIHEQKEGESVAGETWSITVQAPGQTKGVTYTVDLCPECVERAPLGELSAMLTEYGTVTRGRRRIPAAATETTATEELPCPVDGCEYVGATQKRLASHLRSQHQQTMAEATGMATDYPCPECDRQFATPQGLGAHRSRAHGFRASSG